MPSAVRNTIANVPSTNAHANASMSISRNSQRFQESVIVLA